MCSTIDRMFDHYIMQFQSDFPDATEVVAKTKAELTSRDGGIYFGSENLVFGRQQVQVTAATMIHCRELTFIAGKTIRFQAQEVILEGTPDDPVIFIAPEQLHILSTAIKIKNTVIYCLPGFQYSFDAPRVEIENLHIQRVKLNGPFIEDEEVAVCCNVQDVQKATRTMRCQAFLEKYEMETEIPKKMKLRSILV